MPGERFHVRLLPEEGGGPGERVVAEVGLEGFNIWDASGLRNLRKYPLHHISRWSMRGSSLYLFTRSPVRWRVGGASSEAAACLWQRQRAALPLQGTHVAACASITAGGCGGPVGDAAGR